MDLVNEDAKFPPNFLLCIFPLFFPDAGSQILKSNLLYSSYYGFVC